MIAIVPHNALFIPTFAAIFKSRLAVMYRFIIAFSFVFSVLGGNNEVVGQDQGHEQQAHEDHDGHDHGAHADGAHAEDCGHHDGPYDPTATALHHVGDANVYTILDAVRIPLPCIVYSSEDGWHFFMSSKFHAGHHDNGHEAYKRFVLFEGNLARIKDTSFPNEAVEIGGFNHTEDDKIYACFNGAQYEIEKKTTLDGGLLGGGITSFWDYSLTKNVVSMILVCLFMIWLFGNAAAGYVKRKGQAPKGIQSLLEPVVLYIRDDVAIPFIGEKKYAGYMPLLLSIFIFILGLNLWGQVPFFGGANVTGSISVTMVIAILVFLIANFKGNKHYWSHILWMPGVPVFVKPLLALIEIMSLFIKPLTLMLRLAGNITAGHIAIVSFIGLIFIFGKSGESLGGGIIGAILSTLLTLFMMSIELIVAFIQAYVFTLLTASYIGAATEEVEHH
jgi:F-type H+-transporting ATPase subunit a